MEKYEVKLEVSESYSTDRRVYTMKLCKPGYMATACMMLDNKFLSEVNEEQILDVLFQGFVDRFSGIPDAEANIRMFLAKNHKPASWFNFEVNDNAVIYKAVQANAVKNELALLAEQLPGMQTKVECPDITDARCYGDQMEVPLMDVVMHLNDTHKWTREKIADWLDDLHDSGVVDLEFKVPAEPVEMEK